MAAVVALIGCTQNDEALDNITNNPEKSHTEFYASMPECDTRTYVEDNRYLRWNADDEITVFAGNSYNGHWQFAGEDGANSGKFNEINEGGFVTGSPLDLTANYAIYPYDENITITEAGVVSLTLPAVQEYNHAYENSFGADANTMMAVTKNTSDNFLSFKNLCGYLKLKFYGNDVTIKSIAVKGNNGEKIAGPATVSMAYGSEPTITMGDDATDTITVDCGEGVALSNDAANPTTFWVVIPEITFEGGITIEVTNINDQTFSKQTTNAVPIENNFIQPMALLGVEFAPTEIPETWKIYYTATAKVSDESWNKDTFGANIVSNEWNEISGEGVITFDGNITLIGNSAFEDCSSLVSITISENVNSIESFAFYGCLSLANITIPDGVILIGGCAFYNCTALDSITIPNSVTSIGDSTFRECRSLASVTIGNGVTSIGEYTFSGCSKLASVSIGNSVTSIGYSAFDNCTSLTSVTIPDSVTSIGIGAFLGCGSLTNITIGDSVTSIGNSAFSGCSKLVSVSIGNSVTTIGNGAFRSCLSLANITIPNSVTSIGDTAFFDCNSLMEVYCKPTTPPMGITVLTFHLNASSRKIYVPASSVEAYKSASGWSSYADHIEGYDFIE